MIWRIIAIGAFGILSFVNWIYILLPNNPAKFINVFGLIVLGIAFFIFFVDTAKQGEKFLTFIDKLDSIIERLNFLKKNEADEVNNFEEQENEFYM